MKVTDFAPRASLLCRHLTGTNLIGLEVGVDVGAHAEALLLYCDIQKLYLVDIWDNQYYYGFCAGRLCKFQNKIQLIQGESAKVAKDLVFPELDFIYFDQKHDYDSVKKDFELWLPKLKKNGVIGVRNYAASNVGLCSAVAELLKSHEGSCLATKDGYLNEILIEFGK
jgi:predicted O-methyltransferase YrrM